MLHLAGETRDLSPPSEEELITALRMCCEVSSGEFPTGFDAFPMGKYGAIYLQKKGVDLQKGISGEQHQENTKIARGFQFVLMLPKEVDAHYAGAGTKQGDVEARSSNYCVNVHPLDGSADARISIGNTPSQFRDFYLIIPELIGDGTNRIGLAFSRISDDVWPRALEHAKLAIQVENPYVRDGRPSCSLKGRLM